MHLSSGRTASFLGLFPITCTCLAPPPKTIFFVVGRLIDLDERISFAATDRMILLHQLLV